MQTLSVSNLNLRHTMSQLLSYRNGLYLSPYRLTVNAVTYT